MWNAQLKKGKIASTAMKDREKYAVVDTDQKKEDDDDSDKEDDEKGDPHTRGWVPAPKESLEADKLDIFLAGDLDFYQLAAGNPLGLFLKLRYGVRLSESKKEVKALEVLEKAYGFAQEAAATQQADEAKKAEEEKKANKGKPASGSKGKGPERPESQDLVDVISMCKTKLYKWRQTHSTE